jgi:hypothetical protein
MAAVIRSALQCSHLQKISSLRRTPQRILFFFCQVYYLSTDVAVFPQMYRLLRFDTTDIHF